MILGIDHIGVAVTGAAEAGETFARLVERSAGTAEDLAAQAVRVCFVPGERDLASPQEPAGDSARHDQPSRGGNGHSSGRVSARLELLEPIGEDSPIGRFLRRRGEGMHHVCFAVDDVEAEMARLAADGFDLVDRAPRRGHGGWVAFLHPRSAHGVLIELLQRDGQDAGGGRADGGRADGEGAHPPPAGRDQP